MIETNNLAADSTSAFPGTDKSMQCDYNYVGERQQQVVAKNIVDLVDQGVNVNDAMLW